MFDSKLFITEGDRASPVPRAFGSNRSNIPRLPPAKAVPPANATVQAARNLKRRSIEHPKKAFPGTPAAEKAALSTQATPRDSVTKPLPDSMRTGRARMAPGGQPRHLQATAASARRAATPASTTRARPSPIQSSAINRRSASLPRESAEMVAMKAKIVQLEGELLKNKTELESLKRQLTRKDQIIGMDQRSLECFHDMVDFQDNRMSVIQMTMQVALDAIGCIHSKQNKFEKDSEIVKLRHELCEKMEDIGRLTSQLAAILHELREKDEYATVAEIGSAKEREQ